MRWLIAEGLAWPDGLPEGRFGYLQLPASEKEIEDWLLQSLRVEDEEREAVECWISQGEAEIPEQSGILVSVCDINGSPTPAVKRKLVKRIDTLRDKTGATDFAARIFEFHQKSRLLENQDSTAFTT